MTLGSGELRAQAHALLDAVLDAAMKSSAPEFYDQSNSPLGRAKHLAYARKGKISSWREGRAVFMKRADVEAFIQRNPSPVVVKDLDVDAAAERVAADFARWARTRPVKP